MLIRLENPLTIHCTMYYYVQMDCIHFTCMKQLFAAETLRSQMCPAQARYILDQSIDKCRGQFYIGCNSSSTMSLHADCDDSKSKDTGIRLF